MITMVSGCQQVPTRRDILAVVYMPDAVLLTHYRAAGKCQPLHGNDLRPTKPALCPPAAHVRVHVSLQHTCNVQYPKRQLSGTRCEGPMATLQAYARQLLQ